MQIAPEHITALFNKRPEKIVPTLERIKNAYALLGSPAYETPCVLIGGTNGKGTTCGYLWHLLAASGIKVGLFSSPHLVHVRERFQVAGVDVSDCDVHDTLVAIQKKLPPTIYDSLTFFEVTTLIAMKLFEREKTEFNVFEVGLGGRWDATNICNPLAVAITSIAMDHENYLGNTLDKIAWEKAGIIRSAKPVFLGASLTTNVVAQEVIEREAQTRGARLWYAPRVAQTPHLQERPEFLQQNFSLAAAVFDWLKSERHIVSSITPSDYPIAGAPQAFTMLGRCQKLIIEMPQPQRSQEFIIDVCHNPAGVEAFAQFIKQSYSQKFPALVSILADKDLNAMLDLLKGIFSPIMLFKSNNARSMQLSNLASRHRDLKLYESFPDVWRALLHDGLLPNASPVAACGSLAAIGEVIDFFSANPSAGHEDAPLLGRSPDS